MKKKKIKIYLITLFALFIVCKGEGHKKNTAKTLITLEQVSVVNIKEVFLLLPDDAFPMEGMSIANRKRLLDHIGEEKASDISPTPIDICDVKNGYLSLAGMQFGWEMCYWNLKGGRKLVAVNSGTESGSEIRVFFHQNEELTEDHNYKLGGNQKFTLADFVDVSQLSPDTRTYAEQQFTKGDYNLYYQLPQKGTALKVSMDADQLMDYDEIHEIPFEATKTLTLKWKNEKWER
ncbi:MAG: hypothetical protein RBR35_11455 [Salinivirgaceae bacterium]|nr:hypothetical protein [Salinivirgaceae bacterium]MDY0281164.1 hypothetical protein [Salinivirgaceae bacterium]